MDKNQIYEIKKYWKDNSEKGIGELFLLIQNKFNVTQKDVIDAIHYDLTGKELGIVL